MAIDNEFSLDRFSLELEAARQSELIRKYGKLASRYKGQAADAKRRLEILEGELTEEYRRNKKEYGIMKDTDAILLRLVKGDPKYEEQFEDWLVHDRKFEDAKNAVLSLVNKGFMIKIEAELWLNNYYSEPTVYHRKPKRIKLDDADEY
jgi:hypothetical protein